MYVRIKDQGSRIWSFENALDLKKKPLQRLLWAKIKWRQSIKKSAWEKLHENEKHKSALFLGTLCIEREASYRFENQNQSHIYERAGIKESH